MSQNTLTSPVGLDLATREISAKLLTEVSWLNNAFGVCEKRSLHADKKYQADISTYPAVLSDKNNRTYIKLLPDSLLGNFCYWQILDRERAIDPDTFRETGMFKLVFWFNYDLIYTEATSNQYGLSNVKKDIKDFFENNWFLNSTIKINNVVTEPRNVYRGFDISEVGSQNLMRPFGCFAFEGYIQLKDQCL